MLAVIYIFLVAKPISVRRLSLLFVLGLILTPSVLAILHVKDSPSHALAIATSVMLLIWCLPWLGWCMTRFGSAGYRSMRLLQSPTSFGGNMDSLC